MICFTSSLIRQLYHFATDFDPVLLQLVGTDIENSLFKYRVNYRHLTFMTETFEMLIKSCKTLTCYSCIFNVQLHVHLKKWTLKFKLLYLRNYASYFNKICRISCVNTPIKSLKVWLKSILPWLKYSIFSRGLFFIGAPCRSPVLKPLYLSLFVRLSLVTHNPYKMCRHNGSGHSTFLNCLYRKWQNSWVAGTAQ